MTQTRSSQALRRLVATAALTAIVVPTIAAAQAKDEKTAGTVDLNRQQATASAAQNGANRNSNDAFVQGVQDYEAERTAIARERADYEARLEAHRQAQASYNTAYARWQADVAACNAGERARCGPVAPAVK